MIFFSGYDEDSTTYRKNNISNIMRIRTIRMDICKSVCANDTKVYFKEFIQLVTAVYRNKDKPLIFSDHYTHDTNTDLELFIALKEDILKYLRTYGYNIILVEDLIKYLTLDIQKMKKELHNRCNKYTTESNDLIREIKDGESFIVYDEPNNRNRLLSMREMLNIIEKGYTNIFRPQMPSIRIIAVDKCINNIAYILKTDANYISRYIRDSELYTMLCANPYGVYLYKDAT